MWRSRAPTSSMCLEASGVSIFRPALACDALMSAETLVGSHSSRLPMGWRTVPRITPSISQ